MIDRSLIFLKSWALKADYFFLALIFFSIPWNTKLTNISIFFPCFFFLVLFKHKLAHFDKRLLYPFILFTSLYWINIIGMAYTDNVKEGLFRLETKLSLLVFPVIIFFSLIDSQKIKQIIQLFILSTLLACLYCEVEIVKLLLASDAPVSALFSDSQYQYTNLIVPLSNLHPTYLSLFINFALICLLMSITRQERSLSYKVMITLMIAFLIAFNIQLASRMGLISLFIAILFSILYLKNKRLKTVLLIIVGIGMIGFTFLIRTPAYKDKFITSFKDSSLETDTPENSISLHYKNWYCSCKMWLEGHVLFGYGTGDEKDVIRQCNVEHNWSDFGHDAHNEYLSSLVRHGIFGLAILLACLVYPFYFSIKNHDFIYVIFLILVSTTFLSESALRAGSALIFYASFNSLLMLRHITAKESIRT
jgi:O-antigen ligase